MAKNKADKAKKEVKNKRHFWKDFKAELKKVVWPTSSQLINSTVAVITIVLVTAVIVFALDLGFEAIKTHGIDKLQASLQENKNTVEESASELSDETSSEMTTDNENVEADANAESTTINLDETENNQ